MATSILSIRNIADRVVVLEKSKDVSQLEVKVTEYLKTIQTLLIQQKIAIEGFSKRIDEIEKKLEALDFVIINDEDKL